jgi:hypothetical protein
LFIVDDDIVVVATALVNAVVAAINVCGCQRLLFLQCCSLVKVYTDVQYAYF